MAGMDMAFRIIATAMFTAITGTTGTLTTTTAVTGMGTVITTTDMVTGTDMDMVTGTDMDMVMDMVTAATVMVMDTGTISHRALQISGKELCAS